MIKLAMLSRRIFVPSNFDQLNDIPIVTFVLPESTQQKVYDLFDEVVNLLSDDTKLSSALLYKQAEKIACIMDDAMNQASYVPDYVLVDGIPLFFVQHIVDQLHAISLDSATLIALPPKNICIVQMNMDHKRII